jgi:hypothetical protein
MAGTERNKVPPVRGRDPHKGFFSLPSHPPTSRQERSEGRDKGREIKQNRQWRGQQEA